MGSRLERAPFISGTGATVHFVRPRIDPRARVIHVRILPPPPVDRQLLASMPYLGLDREDGLQGREWLTRIQLSAVDKFGRLREDARSRSRDARSLWFAVTGRRLGGRIG